VNQADQKPRSSLEPETAKSEPAPKKASPPPEQPAHEAGTAQAALPRSQGQKATGQTRKRSKEQVLARPRGAAKAKGTNEAASRQEETGAASDPKGTNEAASKQEGAGAVQSASALPWSASQQRPPHGVILPYDLRGAGERRLLDLNGGRAGLFAVGEWKPGARPLILVHGYNADFEDVQSLVDRFRGDRDRQILVLAYDDRDEYTANSGVEMARALNQFRNDYPWSGQGVDIVAHSMGGMVTRRALNEMTWGRIEDRSIDSFEQIRFMAVDSPWHGFRGPGDRYLHDRGLWDMQNSSGMFMGSPGGATEAERAGLLTRRLPQHVQVQVVSADQRAAGLQPDGMLDYTDQRRDGGLVGANLAQLRQSLVEYLGTDRIPTPRGDLGDRSFSDQYLRALMQDADWPQAEQALRSRLDARGPEGLSEAFIVQVLEQHMPRYAGSHGGPEGVMHDPQFVHDVARWLR
jgi:pimeloyl-ACP methyl ester carboxylesterase